MRVKQIIVTAAALLAVGITSIARAEGIAVGGKVSTLGYGAELGYRFNDWIGLRAGINGGSYDFDGTDAGVDYRYSMDFDTVPVLLDWHVFGGTFRLTGGLVRNSEETADRSWWLLLLVPVFGVTSIIGSIICSALVSMTVSKKMASVSSKNME